MNSIDRMIAERNAQPRPKAKYRRDDGYWDKNGEPILTKVLESVAEMRVRMNRLRVGGIEQRAAERILAEFEEV